MAKQVDILKLLKDLGLEDYYPSKLNRQKFYEITNETFENREPQNERELPWRFISRVNSLDYKARNTHVSQSDSTAKPMFGRRARKQKSAQLGVHPLDLELAVFLCCDAITKQDLVHHLWQCRLAVPFILNDSVSADGQINIWPLRSIVMQWQEQHEGLSNAIQFEKIIITHPMKKVGVLRLGEIGSVSKSAILNEIISEKGHHIFFNKDSELPSKPMSPAVEGMVEVGWFFPKGDETDTFKESLLFANLRGDGVNHVSQFEIMAMIMEIIIVFCTYDCIADCATIDKVRAVLDKDVRVIIVIVDKKSDDDVWVDHFINKNFPNNTITAEEILPIQGMLKVERTEELRYLINNTATKKIRSLEEAVMLTCRQHSDENEPCFQTGKNCADNIINAISRQDYKEGKEKVFPSQGKLWKEWAFAEKEYYRLELLPESVGITAYRDDIENKKNQYRLQQYKEVNQNTPETTQYFMYYNTTLSGQEKSIFMRYLKLGLDVLSRQMVPDIYRQYHDTLKTIHETKLPEERHKLKAKLDHLDCELSNVSIGIEHFTRELAQMFEAAASQGVNEDIPMTDFSPIKYTKLAEIVTDILLEGYPVEIMDGDVSAIPTMWVQELLRITTNRLKARDNHENIKIFSLSVLGIQSSGKSTMLNTMFGFQFAVSAGRCTRGVYLQLVKIADSLSARLGVDYIFVFDTEGLKASEMVSENTIKHDNELSTFVIGSADTTLINLMGENITYLSDNLPITVHAFLRMNLVGLSPKCTIVYQGVDKQNKGKLMQQNRALEEALDKLTETACESEKTERRLFKEVIQFDIGEDIKHIPALIEGEQPMGPVNVGYSVETVRLRNALLQSITETPRESYHEIEDLSDKIIDLWDAIKTDNFVFEFKNTLEAHAKESLNRRLQHIRRQMENTANENMFTAETRISNSSSLELCKSTYKKEGYNLSLKITEQYEKCATLLNSYFNEPEKIFAHILKGWKTQTEENVRKMRDQIKSRAEQNLTTIYESKCEELSLEKETMAIIEATMEEINEVIKISGSISDTEFATIKEAKWKKSKEKLDVLYSKQFTSKDQIEADALSIVKELCQSQWHEIGSIVGSRSVTVCDFNRFRTADLESVDHGASIHRSRASKEIRSQKALERIFNSVKEDVGKRLKLMECRDESYKRGIMYEILSDVHQRASPTIEYVTPRFQAKIVLHTAGQCAQRMQKIQDDYRKKHGTLGILQRHRTIYDNLLQSHVTKQNTIQAFKVGFCDIVEDGMYHSVVRGVQAYVSNTLLQEPQYFVLQSKNAFLLDLYHHLVGKDNQKSLLEFIENPTGTMLCHLTQLTKDSMHRCHGCLTDKVQVYIKHLAEKVHYILEKCFQSSEGRQSTGDVIRLAVSEIQCELVLRNIDSLPVTHLNVQSITLQELGEALQERIDRLESAVQSKINFTLNQVLLTAETTFIQSHQPRILGCTERCPNCDEICKLDNDHSGFHESIQHRPLCVVGRTVPIKRFWGFSAKQELDMRTCSELFTYDQKKATKSYDNVYQNWLIRGDYGSDQLIMWKWFIVTNRDTLEGTYNLSLSKKIPKAWNMYTKQQVLQELEKLKQKSQKSRTVPRHRPTLSGTQWPRSTTV